MLGDILLTPAGDIGGPFRRGLLFVLLFCFAGLPTGSSLAAGPMDGWLYQRPVTVDNSANPDPLDDYQVKVTLTSSNFDFSRAKPDGSDIRFLGQDGSTPLSHWIETWDAGGGQAVVWVRVPSVPGGGSAAITMHYGNPAAGPAGSGHDTFLFYDGFESFGGLNAAAPLVTPTYEGSGQLVHPDVVYVPGGWNGFEFWMGMTPYPSANDDYENPSVLASHDGIGWEEPPGISNPLVPMPPAPGHNDDVDLLLVDGVMVLYYVETNADGNSYAKRLTSANGTDWSAPQTVMSVPNYLMSPAYLYEDGTWYVWYLRSPAGCTSSYQDVRLRTSSDGISWGPELPVYIDHPGRVVWHFDVQKDGEVYVMLFNAYPQGFECIETSLYYAESTDRQSWDTVTRPVLAPSASGWDDSNIYRASFLAEGGFLRIWYSARSTAGQWRAGYSEGRLADFLDANPYGMNAADYLETPTYEGSGQVVHPDVVYVPGGWNGYSYWMAMTPYPNGNDDYENPSVLASDDGIHWEEPPGIVNPLAQMPTAPGHNDDPDMLLVNGTMIIYYNDTNAGDLGWSHIRRLASTDGITWTDSPPSVVDKLDYIMSPAVIYEDGMYYLWYLHSPIGCSSPFQNIWLRTSADGITWGAEQAVNLEIPFRVPWHFDIVKDGDLYRMLFISYPEGSTCDEESLYYAESTDRVNWTANSTPVLTPNPAGWDNQRIYRCSFLAEGTNLRIWYSARASSREWHVGYTEGDLEDFLSVHRHCWDVTRGTVAAAPDHPRSGSFGLRQDGGTTYPWLIKQVSGMVCFTAWLYDELNTATNLMSLVRLYDPGPPDYHAIGTGVWVGNSAANYSYHTEGFQYSTTALSRTAGWHQLSARVGGEACDLLVDGQTVATLDVLDEDRVSQASLEGYRGGTGWFDDAYLRRYAEPEPEALVGAEETNLVSCSLIASPAWSTVPFVTTFTATLGSFETTRPRTRIAARIDVRLAGGAFYSNWRSGWRNMMPSEIWVRSWSQPIPALGSLIGFNDFTLTVADVTPAPYNQPPYPPSGDTETSVCTILAMTPQ